jgi:hypothetical protein
MLHGLTEERPDDAVFTSFEGGPIRNSFSVSLTDPIAISNQEDVYLCVVNFTTYLRNAVIQTGQYYPVTLECFECEPRNGNRIVYTNLGQGYGAGNQVLLNTDETNLRWYKIVGTNYISTLSFYPLVYLPNGTTAPVNVSGNFLLKIRVCRAKKTPKDYE